MSSAGTRGLDLDLRPPSFPPLVFWSSTDDTGMPIMPGRNDPCPCGSGLKYKKCCMEKDAQAASQREAAERPSYVDSRDIPGLIALFERRASDEFIQAQMQVVDPDCVEPLKEVLARDPDFFDEIQTAIVEAGVAEMARRWAARRFVSYLTPTQVRYLEEMAVHPLRVWLVRKVEPGVGMTLEDDETGEVVEVRERSASREVVAMQLVVGRVIFDQAFPTFSNCFLIHAHEVESLKARFSRGDLSFPPALAQEGSGLSDARLRSLRWENLLVRDFIRRCVRPKPITMMDAATNTLMEVVHDRFTVLDEPALVAGLDSRDDIDGDPDDQFHWMRFVELSGVQVRILAHLSLEDGVLTMVSRSRAAAKDNRAWLKRLFGDLLRFRSRRIDPPEAPTGGRKAPEPPAAPRVAIPREAIEALYRNTYGNWADTPLPAFGDQTPRALARTDAGEAKVIAMVRSYQAQENAMARDQGRKPTSLSWLLRDCGIDPKKL